MNYFSAHLRRAVLQIFCLVIGLMLAGCGGPARPTPAATIAAAPLPADWQRTELPQLSLALPPQWTVTAAEDIELTGAIADMVAQNPQLQAMLEQGQAEFAAGKVQLIAFDLDPEHIDESGFPTNMRIGRQSYPEPPNLQQVADVNEQDLRKAPGFSDVQRTPIAIGDTTATRLTSTLQINDATGQPLKLAFEQYLLVRNTDVYAITLTTPASQQPMYRPIFDQILATLQFK